MTLVCAKKLEDCIYIFADTFWETPMLGSGKKVEWAHGPLVKIIVLPNDQVIAYAGNSHFAQHAIDEIKKYCPSDASEILLGVSRSNPEDIDFLLADRKDMSLRRISSNSIQEVRVSYLGSPSGFNEFQRISHGCGNEDLEEPIISMIRLPEGLSEKSREKFASDYNDFERVLLASQGDEYGGYPASYIITSSYQQYWGMTKLYRGPLSNEEMRPVTKSGWNSINLNDGINGGYHLLSGGGKRSFFFHIPNGNLGFIYRGDESVNLHMECYNHINGYDFSYLVKKANCLPYTSTWRSRGNDRMHLERLLLCGELDRAVEFVNELLDELSSSISSKNNKKVNLSDGVLKELHRLSPIILSLDEIMKIDYIFDARVSIFSRSHGGDVDSKAVFEQEQWRALLDANRFKVSVNK